MAKPSHKKALAGAPAVPVAPSGGPPPFPVVGIGASAGGLDAFTQLLQALPPDTGMAFVLVSHLSASHESALAQILARSTRMPVVEVSAPRKLEPNTVYVIAPGQDITLADTTLQLMPRSETPGQHRPIDSFLQSLAEDSGYRSIAVILSGTANDGTVGVEEVKGAGGLTFAQDDTAQHEGMPRSAIATGCIDFVLPPADIAREIGRIARHPFVDPRDDRENSPLDEAGIARVIQALQQGTAVDFSNYKRSTLYRRIMRRMILHKVEQVSDYVRLLEHDAAEVAALYQDILINVTSFFRTPEAFAVLKSVIFPRLVQHLAPAEPLRIWSLGCSTGEEPYSIAMAFMEFTEEARRIIPVQIFGTDINAAALDRARAGFYPARIADRVSPDRLRRFFVPAPGGYRVSKVIRDMCIFARHNGLADPPFSRIDLISCRHLLIYFEAMLQQQFIPLLHYALKPSGALWLGSSETIGSYRDLFDLDDVKQKFYARKPGSASRPQRVPGAAPRIEGRAIPAFRPSDRNGSATDMQREIDRILLAQYAPPGVLVDGACEILQFRGDAGAFFLHTPGRASLNLLKILREGLAAPVRIAIGRARSSGRAVREEHLPYTADAVAREVSVEVIPLLVAGHPENFLVTFHAVAAPADDPAAPATLPAPRGESDRLRRELLATEQHLQAVIEQQDAANDELQAANEEVQSSNEELQSINEELETSKEEIQSSNEELMTLNDELHHRNLELTQSSNDMLNLVSNAELAIVMFGPDLRIRRFTPTAERVLSVIPADIGRPVGDLKFKLEIPDLETLLEDVIRTLTPVEREAQDRQGRWHQVRIRPYVTVDSKVDGAVLVAVDINTLKRAARAAEANAQRLKITQDQAPMGICESDRDGRILRVNDAFCAIVGYPRETLLARTLRDIVHPDDTAAMEQASAAVWDGGSASYRLEKRYRHADGRTIWTEVHGFAIRTPSGEPQAKVVLVQDITERRQAEIALRESESRFRALIDSTPVLIWVTSNAGVQFVNRVFLEFTGAPESELLADGWIEFIDHEDREEVHAAYRAALARREPFRVMGRLLRSDGQYRWMLIVARPRGGDTPGMVGSMHDISDLKEADEALRRADQSKDQFLALLAHELRAPLAPLHNVVELLRTPGVDAATDHWAREILGRQVLSLARMVDDLLDISRIAHGKIALRLESVDLTLLLARTVEMMQQALLDCKQELDVNVPVTAVHLTADPVRLEQVFGNLLRNASKFTPEGGRLWLTMTVEPANPAQALAMPIVVVRVRDDGDGIEPAMLDAVFDPFVQAHVKVDRTRGGLGIGLTLVRNLVELHQGTVTAHSDGLGKGSEFVVRLPVRHAVDRLADVEVAPPLAESPQRILLIDDSVDASEALARLLRHFGHEVLVGHDGRTAYDLAVAFRPDVALLDIGLPGASGFDLARQMRRTPELAHVLLIALTGYGSQEDRALGREAGFDHHFTKPVDLRQLRRLLGEASPQP